MADPEPESMPSVAESKFEIVLALGRVVPEVLLFATEFFRTRPPATPAALSRRPLLGLEDGVVVECNFCWCLNSRSRLAKHLEHSGHSNGFSLV